MAYCTRDDLEKRFSVEAVSISASRNPDRLVDDAVIDRAIADAEGEIDAWIGERYPLPLDAVPPVLRRIATDLAMYHLDAASGKATDKGLLKRHENALALLKSIARGQSSLGLPATDAVQSSGGVAVASRRSAYGDLGRRFHA